MDLQTQRTPILMLANGLDIGGLHGGAERFAVELCSGLQESGWPTFLALLVHTGSNIEQYWERCLEESGVRVNYLNINTRRRLISSIQNASVICQENKINIVHSHCKIGSLIAADLKLSGTVKRAIQTVHAGKDWGDGILAWVLRQIFSKWVFGIVLDEQVGVSKKIKNRLLTSPGTLLRHQKITYIPNAISDSWYSVASSKLTSSPRKNDSPIIGTVGALTIKKDHRTLLDAAALLKRDLPNLSLWIIGNGPEKSNLIDWVHLLGLKDNVIFWGAQENVRKFFDQMDLFVLPSLIEGLPTVLLESMARHVPIVATNIPGNAELVENEVTGWLVTPQDSQKLAITIQYALENPDEALKVTERAFQKVQGFLFSSIIPQYIQIYQNLENKIYPR